MVSVDARLKHNQVGLGNSIVLLLYNIILFNELSYRKSVQEYLVFWSFINYESFPLHIVVILSIKSVIKIQLCDYSLLKQCFRAVKGWYFLLSNELRFP